MTSLIRVFAVRMKKAWVLIYQLSAQQKLWSDRADVQTDLSLRWSHSHFVGFVMRRRDMFSVSLAGSHGLHRLMFLASHKSDISKQCRPRSEAQQNWSGPTLFGYQEFLFEIKWKWKSTSSTPKFGNGLVQLIMMEKSTGQIWVNRLAYRRCIHAS